MSDQNPTPTPRQIAPHVLADLGLVIIAVDEDLHGTADVVATMWSPGTSSLRASVLIAWADTLLGLLAVRALAPRVPVTLEIDVHLFRPISGTPTVRMVGRVTKSGSSIHVSSVDFYDDSGRVGFGHSVFMAAPDPRLTIPTGSWALDRFRAVRGTLTVPLVERVGCERTGLGSAVLPWSPSVQNASKTLNGGLLAIPVEEAALSAIDTPTTITSLQMRFLRPVRTGAMANAIVHNGLGEVEVHDAESGALAVLATTRFAGS
jgi:acyl-coenzyme A thioesterase PaaI-like protein